MNRARRYAHARDKSTMAPYSKFRPTCFDPEGLACEERQTWLVFPYGRNRDSDCLTESNFHSALRLLGGEGDDVEVHRFGHWACGWFEIIIVRPDSAAHDEACAIECDLANYPVLDESDFSDREQVAADETWKHCYSTAQRIAYMRKHSSQFEFRSFAEMLGCARGLYFSGHASEICRS